MANELHQPDEPYQPDEPPRRQPFFWPLAYIVGILGGGTLLPAWAFYAWMEADKAATQAGKPVDDGSPMGATLAMAAMALMGAVGGLVAVGLAHLAMALLGGFRRRRG